jgi:hypothetical protein
MHMVKHFLLKKSFRTVSLKNLWSKYLTVPEFVDITVVEIDNKLIANFPTVLFAKYKFGMKNHTRTHTSHMYTKN